jgi:hypothetical protein
MANVHDLIAQAIDKAASSTDLLSSESLESVVRKYTVARWRTATITKVAAVGFLTGLPGGLSGGILAAMDLAYLFAAAGRGCYGIGYILGKPVNREKDLKLILACWCGSATAVSAVTAGKVGLKVFGKAAAGPAAAFAVKVAAKASFKGGGKIMAKVVPQMAAKLAGQAAGKGFATVVPVLGGAVSAGISYWVAESLMTAAEQYYRHEYVEFNDPEITLGDVVDNLSTMENVWEDT